jgi:AbrB family looped-hinge helix DNA binding protein
MSQALVKLQRKGQMVIPRSLREEAGIVEGTLLKVALIEGGQFLLTPQVTLNRSVLSSPKNDRQRLLRELAMAVDDLRQDAKAKGIDRMPMRQINRAVATARQDLKNKRPPR